METIQPIDTDALLDEAISTARRWETSLSPSTGGRQQATDAFEALKQGRLVLDTPQADVQRIRLEDFAQQNLSVTPKIAEQMGAEGFAFYIVPLTVLLFPGRGAQYRLLEMQCSFEPLTGPHQLAIQRVFPNPQWKPVLDWGGAFSLALDSNLEWSATVPQTNIDTGIFSGALAGQVKPEAQQGSFVRIDSFNYTLGRMEIEAQFTATVAMWRIDSPQAIRDQRQVRLVMLLKAPSEVRQVTLHAAAQAEASFDWLSAQIGHVFARLSETLQHTIRQQRGLPTQAFQSWTLHLPQ